MKKRIQTILYTCVLILVSFANIQKISAQSIMTISKNVSIKKVADSLISQKVGDYMEHVVGLAPANQDECYSGTFENIYYLRKGLSKSVYSIDYSVRPLVNQGKITLEFCIDGIKQSSTVCDQTQKQTISSLSKNEVFIGIEKAITDLTNDFTDCLRVYIKEGTESVPRPKGKPDWAELNYIVGNNSVSYYKVLNSKNNLSKEGLYKIFENYFTYAYGSGKAVIENKNPQDCSIVAKGIYADIHNYYSGWGFVENYDVKHIVNIQCREGRARVTITIGDYDIHRKNNKSFSSSDFTRNIAAYEPFGREQDEEMTECLMKLERLIILQIGEMQKAIDEGNTAVDTIDNW